MGDGGDPQTKLQLAYLKNLYYRFHASKVLYEHLPSPGNTKSLNSHQ